MLQARAHAPASMVVRVAVPVGMCVNAVATWPLKFVLVTAGCLVEGRREDRGDWHPGSTTMISKIGFYFCAEGQVVGVL